MADRAAVRRAATVVDKIIKGAKPPTFSDHDQILAGVNLKRRRRLVRSASVLFAQTGDRVNAPAFLSWAGLCMLRRPSYLRPSPEGPSPRFLVWLGFQHGEPDGCPARRFAELGRRGQNVTIEYRWAEGKYDRLPRCRGLAQLKVESSSPMKRREPRGKQATSTIPIVMAVSGDAVLNGLVAILRAPAATYRLDFLNPRSPRNDAA